MSRNTPALPWWRMAFYGLPGLPLAAVTLPVYVHVPTFYAVEVGLGLGVVGAILLFARLWDAATDPLVGFLSDRTGGPFGPRKPWLLAGALLTAVSGYLLFNPPEQASSVYLLFVTVALYLGWTMAVLPYNAWGAELTDDYHRRTTVTAWREGAVVAGTLLAVTLPHAVGNGVAEGLSVLGLLLLLILPLAACAAAIAVPKASDEHSPKKLSLSQILAVMAKNAAFKRLLAAWFLNGIANGLPASLFLLFTAQILDAPDQSGPLLLAYFLSAVLGLPVWLKLSRWMGKHRTWCFAMSWACLWFAGALFLGPGDTAGFAVICIATGLALGADLALPPSLQADVIDVDRASGGNRNTGAYFALWGMAQKLALALAVGIAFPALEMAGFQADAGALGATGDTDGERADWVLAGLYAGLPIVLKIGAMAVIWSHPITAEKQHELARQIAAKG